MASVLEISSSSNKRFKSLCALLTSRGIDEQGSFLVSGAKLLRECSDDPILAQRAQALIGTRAQLEDWQEYLPELARISLTSELFRGLDSAGTNKPLLQMSARSLVKIEDFENFEESYPGATLVVPFQNPENVGAIIRTAAALGVDRVLLTEESANPFLPKAIRAGGLSIFRLSVFKGPKLADLIACKTNIFALDASGNPLEKVHFPRTFLLLCGIEGPGLKHISNDKIQFMGIPMHNSTESLNAATAAAIALYVWKRSL